MFITTIIPTIGRPTLERAIESALMQDLPSDCHDVIVVNDSGKSLDDKEIFHHPRVTLINTNHCGASIARNVGAAIACSKYLHFLDDDDYLLPGGLQALFEIAEFSHAVWIYGALRCVDNNGILIFDNQPQVRGNLFSLFIVGETISLIPSIINREAFFKAGGFDPLIMPSEDRDFACRLSLIGDFDRTDQFIAVARIGVQGSSIDNTKMKLASRIVREKGLNLPGALARMQDSVNQDVNWRGRGCRAYLFSSILNLLDGRICLGVKRIGSSLLLAGYYPYRLNFWRGLFYNHEKQYASRS